MCIDSRNDSLHCRTDVLECIAGPAPSGNGELCLLPYCLQNRQQQGLAQTSYESKELSFVLQVARQQQRFAQAQATKDLDWDELNTLVTSDEGKRELAALRTTFFDLRSKSEGSKVLPTCANLAFKKIISSAISTSTCRLLFALLCR